MPKGTFSVTMYFTNWSFTIQSYSLFISKSFEIYSNKRVPLICMTLMLMFHVIEILKEHRSFYKQNTYKTEAWFFRENNTIVCY